MKKKLMKKTLNYFKTFISGLFLIVFLFLSKNYTQAEVLCSFEGPDVSEDLMKLTNFVVSGPSLPRVGDKINVSFKLQNVNKENVRLGSKGVFVAARDPEGKDVSFGFTRGKTIFYSSETISVSSTFTFEKEGTFQFWPSYHLYLGENLEKFGPEKWHLCEIKVQKLIEDSDKDGIPDEEDNCPTNYNPDQKDVDSDKIGDACDPCDDRDFDKDGIKNCLDKCPEEPETYNDYQDDDGCPDEKIRGFPDLLIEDVICDPQQKRIGYLIKNNGNLEAPSGHKTALIVRNQKVDEDLINFNLSPGSQRERYFLNFIFNDSIGLKICADHLNSVEELNETNNCYQTECNFPRERKEEQPPPSLPDLTFEFGSKIHYGQLREIGFTFVLWNASQVDAPASQAELWINNVKVREKRLDPIGAGQKRTEIIPYDFSNCNLCQEYEVEIRLDTRNEISEQSETNNTKKERILCSRPASYDLEIKEISLSGNLIWAQIANNGPGVSPTTTVKLYIDGREVASKTLRSLSKTGIIFHSLTFDNYTYFCSGDSDRIEVRIETSPVVYRDCQTGEEKSVDELVTNNNQKEISNECSYPDLYLDCPFLGDCKVNNIGRSQAERNSLHFYCRKNQRWFYILSESIPALNPGETHNIQTDWNSLNREVQRNNCEPSNFSSSTFLFLAKVDAEDEILESNELNNEASFQISTLSPNIADVAVERVWLEKPNKFCYEIKNRGTISVSSFCHTNTFRTYIELEGPCAKREIYQNENDLRSGETRRVCLDIPSNIVNQCRQRFLIIRINTDYDRKCESSVSPEQNNVRTETFYNPCSQGLLQCSSCQPCELVKVQGRILYQEADQHGRALVDANGNFVFKPARFVNFKITGDAGSGILTTDSQGYFVAYVNRRIGGQIHLKIGDCEMFDAGFNFAARIGRDFDRCNEFILFLSRNQTIPQEGDVDFGELKAFINDQEGDFDAKLRNGAFWFDPNDPCTSFTACDTNIEEISEAAAYFNIAETILVGLEYANAHRDPDESDTIGKVDVQWPDSEWSNYSYDYGEITLYETHGFDDGGILHEYGHFLEQEISTNDWSLAEEHTICTDKDDTEFAWREGFPEYFSTLVAYLHQDLSDPKFISNPDVDFQTAEEIARGCGTSSLGKEVEGVVVNVLWDLFDETSQEEPFDEISGKDDLVFKIFDKELDNTIDAPDLCELIREGWDCRSEVGGERHKIDPILTHYGVSCERGCGYSPQR